MTEISKKLIPFQGLRNLVFLRPKNQGVQTTLLDLIGKNPLPGETRIQYLIRACKESKVIDELGNTDYNHWIGIYNTWEWPRDKRKFSVNHREWPKWYYGKRDLIEMMNFKMKHKPELYGTRTT